jgi:hypothetical protein
VTVAEREYIAVPGADSVVVVPTNWDDAFGFRLVTAVDVRCTGCRKLVSKVAEPGVPFAHVYGIDPEEEARAARVANAARLVVTRRCPACKADSSIVVPAVPHQPIRDAFHGDWRCLNCDRWRHLGKVHGTTGRITIPWHDGCQLNLSFIAGDALRAAFNVALDSPTVQ